MTDEFSADWLAMREPYDAAARSGALTAAFLEALPPSRRIVDLGAGRGANARCLEAAANGRISWVLVDRDLALLQRVAGLSGPMTTRCLDFAPDPALIDFSGIDGVTGSALFDLVSQDWFERFVAITCGLPSLFALTTDGKFEWQPSDPLDESAMTLFEADMQRDKGFGPAMGAAAPEIMETTLRRAGFRVRRASSPWQLGSEDGRLMSVLVDLIADVACRAGEALLVEAWRERRKQQASAGALGLTVGHVDILALPKSL